MTIRTMTIEDYEKAYDLWINTTGMGLNTTDDSKEGIARYLLRNPNTCFVAEDNGELLGVIISGHDGRRGFIYHTTVKEEYRGQGIGKKLVDSALTALKTEGIHKVALVVFEKNASGNIFWEKAGFTVRDDLIYRNKNIHELQRIDLI
ncbi:MAG: GNAT family N-acetyltransferase [Lachnospiraceae bacterium]|nr:GNAT family N-acetyltransferase [Lachnospiraceae bacterium]